ncbi:MAG: glucosidase [Cyanobacteria bacterium RU_5_0]|nr:glucosidase [Cyanobacteria bacterium RU_5_0]
MSQEEKRLQEFHDRTAHWRRWGPYVSERQWGTVREDYSESGAAWDYLPHDHARSRAYRWGEDGIAGISDNHQRLCFAITFWNGVDPILKERLFGVTGNQGNHGEDVKEYYFYLDNTPTHSYMKYLYKYPHSEFPYAQLVEENQRRDRQEFEFELLDTGIFEDDRYFDVFIEYAKADPEDMLIKISITNRGNTTQTLHLLPTLWFRNTWAWEYDSDSPVLQTILFDGEQPIDVIEAIHSTLGTYRLYCCHEVTIENTIGKTNSKVNSEPSLLFTNNETNYERLFNTNNTSPYVKDGINDYVVNGKTNAVNPEQIGTKASAHYRLTIAPQHTQTVRLRLCQNQESEIVEYNGHSTPYTLHSAPFDSNFDRIFQTRQHEADEFYDRITPANLSADQRNIQRQAFAGMLWSKQFYHHVINEWLNGDPAMPMPPEIRKIGRNREWIHLHNEDILSMPDKWEYPYYCVWDTAFHAITLAMVDPEYAKQQLDLMTREWYMHPNGQIPAYEWAFSDVNPPVHAWATWQVYKIEQTLYGKSDRQFLERVFQKLLLNFTWWVNRKDRSGMNIFEGGFLGLDNIGVFDRSTELPTGGYIEQADGTSWMGMYCLNLLTIALELAQENSVYEDIATKFFEHFLYIADAMNHIGEDRTQLWDGNDGFFYDVLHLPNDEQVPLKVRSMVGLIPLFAVTTLEPSVLNTLPNFKKRLEWFIRHRPDLKRNVACMETRGVGARRMLALCYVTLGHVNPEDRFRRILEKLLDENEFLSDYGIRALSKFHKDQPYYFDTDQTQYRVDYEPAESSTGLFGGNSNWRGPVWMPVNYLIIEALQHYHFYLGDDFKIECPTASGNWMTLWEVANDISQRLMKIFLQDPAGRRPVYGDTRKFQTDPHWRNLILFYEYFHADNGAGIGASHQTGWTGLVAKLLQQLGDQPSSEAQNHELQQFSKK